MPTPLVAPMIISAPVALVLSVEFCTNTGLPVATLGPDSKDTLWLLETVLPLSRMPSAVIARGLTLLRLELLALNEK